MDVNSEHEVLDAIRRVDEWVVSQLETGAVALMPDLTPDIMAPIMVDE